MDTCWTRWTPAVELSPRRLHHQPPEEPATGQVLVPIASSASSLATQTRSFAPTQPAEVLQTATAYEMLRTRSSMWRWLLRILVLASAILAVVLPTVFEPIHALFPGVVSVTALWLGVVLVKGHHVCFNLVNGTLSVRRENILGIPCWTAFTKNIHVIDITEIFVKEIWGADEYGISFHEANAVFIKIRCSGSDDDEEIELMNTSNGGEYDYATTHKDFWGHLFNAHGGAVVVKTENQLDELGLRQALASEGR